MGLLRWTLAFCFLFVITEISNVRDGAMICSFILQEFVENVRCFRFYSRHQRYNGNSAKSCPGGVYLSEAVRQQRNSESNSIVESSPLTHEQKYVLNVPLWDLQTHALCYAPGVET